MSATRVVVVGAGVGGLVAALELARAGCEVIVCERQAAPGGKMRQVRSLERTIDAGPTVFTMRWVFDRIFADAGTSLEQELDIRPLNRLARHAWLDGSGLDLFADVAQSTDAIGAFVGAAEARGFTQFCQRARDVYQTLEQPFIRSSQPTPMSLALGAGLSGFGAMLRISPFTTLHRALQDYFGDPRLQQLFGRYATYCGSSPFLAPATLMLVAHVEQDGVWIIDGGMHKLAQALVRAGERAGVTFRYDAGVKSVSTRAGRISGVTLESGEYIETSTVLVNSDAAAIAEGALGPDVSRAVTRMPRQDRSLSAVTWAMTATISGFDLIRHNVFFSSDYASEFDEIFKHNRIPGEPTIYVCAQDRGDAAQPISTADERLLVLINAPANGDVHTYGPAEIASCQQRTFALLARYGLRVSFEPDAAVVTAPDGFNKLFPATGGALYGAASHGWAASFSRPSAKTSIPGLYLAGGGVHPGPGVPMAALSGWLGAAHILADRTSRGTSIQMAMPGGTSMR